MIKKEALKLIDKGCGPECKGPNACVCGRYAQLRLLQKLADEQKKGKK